ncbi:MAG: hypothetical protein MK080_07830 [Opitutales bacterium]|nr:hypothetical protein [Opitutales bacterium]NRA26542.1 hypothetical protein [Opitutales bacterium]
MRTSQKPKKLTDEQLDDLIDSLLTERVEPSADFTARALNKIGSERIVQGPWISAKSWVTLVGTMAAIFAIVVGMRFGLADSETLQPINNKVSDSTPDVVPATPLNEELQPETIYDAEELLENLAPLLNDNDILTDLNMLLES